MSFNVSLVGLKGAVAPLAKVEPDKQQEIVAIKPQEKVKAYGNKHDSLLKLADFVESEGIEGVKIPLPKGISHEEIAVFLEKEAPKVFVKWKTLESMYSQHQRLDERGVFLDKTEVKKLLSEINEAIVAAFKRGNRAFVNKLWLKELESKGLYVMVRSSGSEDSKKIANAGGNESICYVHPKPKDIMEACGKVVASYFAKESLKNRLEMGDNPFETPLALSLFVQELIGEPVGGSTIEEEIPVSCVLFSHEPNYSEDAFKCMTISLSYGHGEGVVNNANIATDTVFVTRSALNPSQDLVLYQNQSKPVRLAPVKDKEGNVVLKPLKNINPKKRGMNQSIIARLVSFARKFEKACGCAMDMEIVVRDNTIYVVQARPVVRPRPTPTYFNDAAVKGKELEALHFKRLVLGKGACQILKSPDEILLANTLKEAEAAFDASVHTCVIVGQNEPRNSHPVVNFSSMGVSCFYSEDLAKTKSRLEQMKEEHTALVCSQSGRVIFWDSEFNPKKCIEVGYYSFPADLNRSIEGLSQDLPKLSHRPVQAKSVQKAIRAMKEAKTQRAAQEALKTLKQEPSVVSLKGKITQLEQKLDISKTNPENAKHALKALKAIDAAVTHAFIELDASINSNAPRLERFFHIDSFATLLATNSSALNTYSLLDVEALVQIANKALAYQNKLPQPAQFVDILPIGEVAIRKEEEALWEAFLLEIEVSKELTLDEKQAFKDLMATLEKCDSVAVWFNLFFLPTYFSEKNASEVCQHLIGGLTEQDSKVISTLTDWQKEIKELTAIVSSFSSPNTFDQAWGRLTHLMNFYQSQEAYIKPIIKSSKLTKVIAIQTMRQVVDLVDACIKSMNASNEHTDLEKVTLLDKMLKANYLLMKTWLTHLVSETSLNLKSDWGLKKYFRMLEDRWEKCDLTNSDELKPSQGFSVQAAALSSGANYARHLPKRLNDLFTLIHQNELFLIAILNRLFTPSVEQMFIPKLLKKTSEVLKQMKIAVRGYTEPFLFGVDFIKGGITLHYNIGLRNHSAIVDIYYDRNCNAIELSLKLFGEARDRWRDSHLFVRITELAESLVCKSCCYTPQEFVATWKFSKERSIKPAMRLCKNLLDYSLSSLQYEFIRDYYKEAKQARISPQIGKMLFLDRTLKYPVDWIPFICDFLRTEEGKHALQEIKNNYGTSSNAKQLHKEYKQLKPYSHWVGSRRKKHTVSSLYDAVLTATTRFLYNPLTFEQGMKLLNQLMIRANRSVGEIANKLLLDLVISKDITRLLAAASLYTHTNYLKHEKKFNEALLFAKKCLQSDDIQLVHAADRILCVYGQYVSRVEWSKNIFPTDTFEFFAVIWLECADRLKADEDGWRVDAYPKQLKELRDKIKKTYQ